MPQEISRSNRYEKMYPVTWDVLHRDCKALSWRLVEKGPWEGILAVTRGGLIPAAIIARELDVRLIDTICVLSYDWNSASGNVDVKQTGSVNVLKSVNTNGKGWLLVDDLVDTGKTARAVREMVPEAHFATVFAKPEGRPLVDTFVTEVSQDTWILFPWDSEPQFVQPIYQSAMPGRS